MAERLHIRRLGGRGDGIAEGGGATIYVPHALPGETVVVERQGMRARVLAVETASPDRIEPFCPYFGACGGCLTQHMSQPLYRAWKQGILADALAKAGIATRIEPLVDAHGAGRRRITLHARLKDGVRVGYMKPRSHELLAIKTCPVAEPALQRAPEIAHALALVLAKAGKPLDVQITSTETGLDIDIRGHGPLSNSERQGLAAAAGAHDLARIALHGEVVAERRRPLVTMGLAAVSPPPGGFLQATRAGEEALAQIVREACAAARRVADLFAGCGPFSLRLAEAHDIHAVDGDAAALAALDKAARHTPRLRRVTTETRDLFRRPLLPPELARFDAVVMDPPRAGAEAQARQLAAASTPTVVSVSCDAGTFARDAGILVAGGYRLERVVPVDQFKHTPHLEIVGVFRRKHEPSR